MAKKKITIGDRDYTMEELQKYFDQLGFIVDVNNLTPKQIEEIEAFLASKGIPYQLAAIKIGTGGGG